MRKRPDIVISVSPIGMVMKFMFQAMNRPNIPMKLRTSTSGSVRTRNVVTCKSRNSVVLGLLTLFQSYGRHSKSIDHTTKSAWISLLAAPNKY